MANLDVPQAIAPPSPATITPALLKTHSITADEYARIEEALGRTPSLTELGIFSVMWSEHCSYKSSRVHLKRLPTTGTRLTGPGSVVQGPGENAGIIDVGDGWACAFKIESHNHPSYIEPYQGAATGVGGILRDIFTMNARPLAVMDSLRFGPLRPSSQLSVDSSQLGEGMPSTDDGQLTTKNSIGASAQLSVDSSELGEGMPSTDDGQLTTKNSIGASSQLSVDSSELGEGMPSTDNGQLTTKNSIGASSQLSVDSSQLGEGMPSTDNGQLRTENSIGASAQLSVDSSELGKDLALTNNGQLRTNNSIGASSQFSVDSSQLGEGMPSTDDGQLTTNNSIGASAQFSVDSSELGKDLAFTNNGQLRSENSIDYARNRQTMAGVVHGVGGYGNCFGVPNLGGETRFEECYSGNPLLNAFALGLVKIDEIFYAKATGVGNPVIYVGAKTGRDGIHGATMASEEFTEGSEQKRPNVQMGDPFLEKLLLEACLEAMATGAVLGIQDMGAAGLTCSTCEMGARGELGLTIELDLVPQRETGMTSYEIMLSESQERMLLVADKGREGEVLRVFEKWGLDASIVGIVTADDTMRVTHHGELVCEIPNKALTDDAPVYHRPVGTWKAPVPLDPPAWVLEELKKPRDYTADLKKLLASANICSKHWIFEQYDSMVQTNTVQGPGGEAGVMRIKGTGSSQFSVVSSQSEAGASLATDNVQLTTKPERGLAMALAGNGRWTYLDPKLGAMHAVAEAARKVACTGATPVAATNCLNFGNPEKPEIMAQLSAAIDGIAEACTALGTPVTGGNVSLYNETKGEGIYPTPVIGVVGILDDVTKAVPSGFQKIGDRIVVAQFNQQSELWRREFGSSEFAKEVLGVVYGTPPLVNIEAAAYCNQLLQDLSINGLVHSLSDVGSGGIATAVAKAAFDNGIGAEAWLHSDGGDESATEALFSERVGSILITCSPENADEVIKRIERNSTLYVALPIGETVADRVEIRWERETAIDVALLDIYQFYSHALESQLTAEVLA